MVRKDEIEWFFEFWMTRVLCLLVRRFCRDIIHDDVDYTVRVDVKYLTGAPFQRQLSPDLMDLSSAQNIIYRLNCPL